MDWLNQVNQFLAVKLTICSSVTAFFGLNQKLTAHLHPFDSNCSTTKLVNPVLNLIQ